MAPEGPSPPRAESAAERLQRTLARAGIASRRAAEDLIREGRVRVDGRVAELGDRVDPVRASVTVDGVPIPSDPDLRYLALNKPAGVTTTLRDPHAARTLGPLLPPGPRVFPVGRLDRDTEGLLLLTNDGALAHRIQHPRYGVEKEYLASVEGAPTRATLRRLVEGVELEDGPARALRATPQQLARGRSALSIVMAEGRKREVRRLLSAVGHPVLRLVRVRVGPVRIGGLRPGAVRDLSADEVRALYHTVGLARARVGGDRSVDRKGSPTSRSPRR